MRLLQLETQPGEILDLHPKVSVVQGLRSEDRALLLDTVRGLARPDTVHAGTGLLEAHGVLFDLDPALIGTLELDGAKVDPVVRPGDLPTQPQTVDARELRRKEKAFAAIVAEVAEKADAETQARAALQDAAAALARARAELAEAEAALGSGQTRAEKLTAELDRLEAGRAQAQEDAEQATAALDAAAASLAEVDERTAGDRGAVAAALERRDAARAALDQALADADDEAPEAVEAALAHEAAITGRLDALRAGDPVPEDEAGGGDNDGTSVADQRVGALEQALLALETPDTGPVEEALAAMQGQALHEGVPSPEAHDLAAQIEGVLDELGDREPNEIDPARVEAARERLEAARQALMAAEEAVRSPQLDPDKVGAIERAHDELLAAVDQADARFRGARARARLDDLRRAEQDALAALGFQSYTDYIMGNSTLSADGAAQQALQAARQELAVAEQEWGEVERATEAALARAVVLDRRRELARRAEALLGPPPVPFAQMPVALRQLRLPPLEVAEAAEALRSALAGAGLDVADDGLEPEDLTALAEAWLAEARDAAERREAIIAELEGLRGAEPVVDDGDRATEEEPAVDRRVAELEARLAEAQEATTEARARLAAHGAAEEERQRLRDALVAAEADLDAARTAAGAAEQEHQRALDEHHRVARLAERAVKARDQVEAEIAAVRQELDQLEALSRTGTEQLATAVEQAEAEHFEARSRLEAATNAVAALNEEGQVIATEIERLQDIVAASDAGEVTPADELEWYLLARLAAQRSVSLAGSLPILLDDALDGLAEDDVTHILERLEPMAEAVQVIVLSDDGAAARWAASAGPSRAAVVTPGPA